MKRHHLGTGSANLAFVALLALTALTFGLSYVPLGQWEVAVGLGIAAIKSIVVAMVFMHLLEQHPSHRIVAATGIFFIVLLVVLLTADPMTRPPKLEVPAL